MATEQTPQDPACENQTLKKHSREWTATRLAAAAAASASATAQLAPFLLSPVGFYAGSASPLFPICLPAVASAVRTESSTCPRPPTRFRLCAGCVNRSAQAPAFPRGDLRRVIMANPCAVIDTTWCRRALVQGWAGAEEKEGAGGAYAAVSAPSSPPPRSSPPSSSLVVEVSAGVCWFPVFVLVPSVSCVSETLFARVACSWQFWWAWAAKTLFARVAFVSYCSSFYIVKNCCVDSTLCAVIRVTVVWGFGCWILDVKWMVTGRCLWFYSCPECKFC
jgi:hypothetical protein